MNICCLQVQRSWSTCVIFLVITLIILQIVHLNLLSQLHMRKSILGLQNGQKLKSRKEDIKHQITALIKRAQYGSMIDSSGDYKIVNNLVESELFRESSKHSRKLNEITVATQGMINHMQNLISLCSTWPGPISVAIFLTEPKLNLAVLVIHTLHRCFPAIHKSASFHLVYPLEKPVSTGIKKYDRMLDLECDELKEMLFLEVSHEFQGENYAHKVLYPVNLLRNVALRNVWSEFIFILDIDIYPSPNLYLEFISFVESKKLLLAHSPLSEFNNNVLFVAPAYEIGENFTPPKNKSELMSYVRSGKVKPFYHDVCKKCQNWTDYEQWERIAPSAEFGVAYTVQWNSPWEPFFLSSHKVPYYDERFKQYGFNRMSQICELHIAGYSFSILNNAFVLHKGFKTEKLFHKNKIIDHRRNKMLFRQFKSELKEKYPNASQKC